MARTPLLILLALAAGAFRAPASDLIPADVHGASAPVSQPHVTAELIPETTTIEPGKPFDVALHLHSDPGWHTYWINPGDAGLATTIAWTLPAGFTAGPIQWPTPEKHNMGPLVTYGYAGDVYLLTTITPPKGDLPQHFDLKAHAEWLVCKEECIPGRGNFTLPLDSGPLNLRLPQDNRELFARARERLPVPNMNWDVKARYDIKPGVGQPGQQALWIQFKDKPGVTPAPVGNLYFFPEQSNVLSANEDDNSKPDPTKSLSDFILALTLQQNGEKPTQISGVLVSDQPLTGSSKAVYIPPFSTDAQDIPISSAAIQNPASGQSVATAVPGGGTVAGPAAATGQPPTLLIGVLGAAFLGGLILNLMPCVLPVLSLKVLALIRHAGEHPKAVWLQGVAFTFGVVLSFWILAGLLLILSAAGDHLGWGFQMQSPGFVLALIFLFFLLALNLFGVFELGTSLTGLDARATNHLSGLASSFGNGALATLAATPCTAPFMGSSLGFAAHEPPAVAMLIFTFLALGMAAPYLLLTVFPGALRFVPKPGAWMEALKQFMGFLLLATVIFLVYVFGALVGGDQIPWLLPALLLAGLAAWIYGRWTGPTHRGLVRFIACVFAFGFLALAIGWSASLAKEISVAPNATTAANSPDGWQPWSQAAVDAALAQGRPVFVDFTAAWCLSCKVNERLALDTDAVRHAFRQKNVALFRADWTRSDPEIFKTLQQFHRDGVPLYLVYSPKDKDTPQVLPEVLTPNIVLQALDAL